MFDCCVTQIPLLAAFTVLFTAFFQRNRRSFQSQFLPHAIHPFTQKYEFPSFWISPNEGNGNAIMCNGESDCGTDIFIKPAREREQKRHFVSGSKGQDLAIHLSLSAPPAVLYQ
jgi:hypothetical protein